jgi:hypothetical protein
MLTKFHVMGERTANLKISAARTPIQFHPLNDINLHIDFIEAAKDAFCLLHHLQSPAR